ncbi:MAG: hypothetical protein LBJ00_11335 [Planctomycetaceae bacterium]|nr:hypothetical protein [Planctomycetaceae bacterium]
MSLKFWASIPKPVWAVGFAPEQPLRDATLACPASGIVKQFASITKVCRNRYFELVVGQNLGVGE